FTTWAPLLIPYYIPRKNDWDYAWDKSQELIQASAPGGILVTLLALPAVKQVLLLAVALVASTAIFSLIRLLTVGWVESSRSTSQLRWASKTRPTLQNSVYEVVLEANGEVSSQVRDRGYDVSRRSYDRIDP